jgi:hypothetical protein
MVSQEFDTLDNTILTKRKTAYAMITSWTEPSSALIALNYGGVLCVIATEHHFLRPSLHDYSNHQRYHWTCFGPFADHHP